SRVDGLVMPREQAAAERGPGVVEALAEVMAARVQHLDGLAGLGKALEIGNLGPINPGVAGPDPLLGAALENEPRHGRGAPPLSFTQNDDHQKRVVGAVEPEAGLEAVEPFDQLEAAGQFDEDLELLWKHHARGMALAIDVAAAVFEGLELHVLV